MEFIGLLISGVLLYALAALAGLLLFLAMRFLPRRRAFSSRALMFGALLPALLLSSLLFIFALDVAFGRATMFGDVREDLPNGYVLTALGKMPYDGIIAPKGSPLGLGCVGQVAVRQQWIAGRYDEAHFPCDQAPKKAKPFFLLDSRTGTMTEYASLDGLAPVFGQAPKLTPTPDYHAQLTAARRLAHLLWALLFVLGPSALVGIFLRYCYRDLRSAPAPST